MTWNGHKVGKSNINDFVEWYMEQFGDGIETKEVARYLTEKKLFRSRSGMINTQISGKLRREYNERFISMKQRNSEVRLWYLRRNMEKKVQSWICQKTLWS